MTIHIFGDEGILKKLFGKQTKQTPEQLYSIAMELFNEGNGDDAYVYMQAAAVKGHAEAAFQMGAAIAEKKTFGTMADAVKYYTIASDNNHAFATTNLATCYQLGKGIEVDYVKAIQLFNKAIKLGDDMAAYNLAQTYLLGVGVKQDEMKGWCMLKSLAAKGNGKARAYMDDLLQKGYNPPIIEGQHHTAPKAKEGKSINKFETDHAPECNINDPKILSLYNSAKIGDIAAKEELIELGGNQMSREAMNALRKLGLIAEDLSDNFKRGTIEYITDAWKTYNVEPLYIVCAWTYPGFIYREYENGKVEFETASEDIFLERISEEMSYCNKKGISPKYRIREVENSSHYCVDILIQDISYSSFYLDIQNNHFVGLYRVFNDTTI